MSRMTIQTDLGRIKDLDTLIKYTAQCIQQLNNIVNGNIEFDSNIMSQTISIKFTTANQDTMFIHSLNRKNLKYMVVDKTISCDVYHNSSKDNATQICLACTQATSVTIILF